MADAAASTKLLDRTSNPNVFIFLPGNLADLHSSGCVFTRIARLATACNRRDGHVRRLGWPVFALVHGTGTHCCAVQWKSHRLCFPALSPTTCHRVLPWCNMHLSTAFELASRTPIWFTRQSVLCRYGLLLHTMVNFNLVLFCSADEFGGMASVSWTTGNSRVDSECMNHAEEPRFKR